MYIWTNNLKWFDDHKYCTDDEMTIGSLAMMGDEWQDSLASCDHLHLIRNSFRHTHPCSSSSCWNVIASNSSFCHTEVYQQVGAPRFQWHGCKCVHSWIIIYTLKTLFCRTAHRAYSSFSSATEKQITTPSSSSSSSPPYLYPRYVLVISLHRPG